jgi:hypothetical protein
LRSRRGILHENKVYKLADQGLNYGPTSDPSSKTRVHGLEAATLLRSSYTAFQLRDRSRPHVSPSSPEEPPVGEKIFQFLLHHQLFGAIVRNNWTRHRSHNYSELKGDSNDWKLLPRSYALVNISPQMDDEIPGNLHVTFSALSRGHFLNCTHDCQCSREDNYLSNIWHLLGKVVGPQELVALYISISIRKIVLFTRNGV